MTYPNPFPPPQPPRPPGWHLYDSTCGCAACENDEPSSPYPPVPNRWPPPATNVAAIIAISCALLGLLVLPILLGPVAIVAGVVGEHQARTQGRKLGKVALLALVIGAIITLIAINRVVPR